MGYYYSTAEHPCCNYHDVAAVRRHPKPGPCRLLLRRGGLRWRQSGGLCGGMQFEQWRPSMDLRAKYMVAGERKHQDRAESLLGFTAEQARWHFGPHVVVLWQYQSDVVLSPRHGPD